MDTTSLGSTTTTLAALRAAGSNGGAPLAAISMQASGAANGIYNTNPELGRALGWRAQDGALLLVPVLGNYDAFTLQLDLDFPAQEFGIAIGDWLGRVVLEFSYGGSPVGTILSTPYARADAKFFASPAVFDHIRVTADPTAPGANFVVPQLHFQNSAPWLLYGSGCAGSRGVPTLSLTGVPTIGSGYAFTVSNLPANGGVYSVVMGFSSSVFPGRGPLPLSLAPLGAPGCFALCDIANTILLPDLNGLGQFSLPIPFEHALAGVRHGPRVLLAPGPPGLAGWPRGLRRWSSICLE